MAVHNPTGKPLAHLDFELVRIPAGGRTVWSSDEFETVAVLIEGECAMTADGKTEQYKRRSVFEDKASAVFISPGLALTVDARGPTTIALCKARAREKHPTAFVTPESVTGEWRGKEGYRRQVFNIVNTETATERIAVGETFNDSGQWSSFPPHKHDVNVEEGGGVREAPLEEIYYFRISPETGFGFQRLYAADGSHDAAYVIRDGDVSYIPRGYHPVANIPEHRLYYLWMLAGEKRIYVWNTDPQFSWMEKRS